MILAASCTSLDEIKDISIEVPIRYSIVSLDSNTETKASLTTTANIASIFPEMEVKALGWFTTSFKTANLIPEEQHYWNSQQSQVDFFSYPRGSISPRFNGSTMVFDYSVEPNSTGTPDLVVAACTTSSGNPVNLEYKHIFTAVNVIYKDVKIGHRISSIKIKDSYRSGSCEVSASRINWQSGNYSDKGDLSDQEVRSATANNTELTGDGCKFMTIPGQSITVEVTIDGKTITATSTKLSYDPGDMVNFYINDNLTISQTEGTVSSGAIAANTDGSYKLTLEAYVTGEYKSDTTYSYKPMDFILVLDYSGSMDKSYSPGSTAITSFTKGVLASNASTYINWKNNQSGYKYFYGGSNQTIRCLKSSSGTRYYAYFDFGSYRYYIGEDGKLYKSSSIATPGGNTIYDVDGNSIPFKTSTNELLFKAKPSTNVTVTTRLNALESSVYSFIDQIQAAAAAGGVEHRVSIIQFQGPRWPRFTSSQSDARKYVLPAYPEYYLRPVSPAKDDSRNKATSSVTSSFTTVNSTASGWELKDALSMVGYGGSTAIDYGIYLARLQMDNCRSGEVGKCIIVFTDGKPTHAGAVILNDHYLPGYGYPTNNSTALSDVQVASKAVSIANDCKSAGAEIYTVFAGNTSDKPDNSTMTGIATDAAHYTDASSGDLSKVFSTIATRTIKGTPTIDIHKDAYVSAVLSDVFTQPGQKTTVKFYQVRQTGYDESTKAISWSTSREDISSQIQYTYDPSNLKFNISGFDYGAKFCGKGADGKGYKLIIEFDGLEVNPSKKGSGINQATNYSTGLYSKSGKLLNMFQPISIDI